MRRVFQLMKTISRDGESLTIEDVVVVARTEGIHVKIAAEAQEKIGRVQRAVEEFIERDEIIYGVLAYGKSAAPEVGLSPDVEYGSQLKVGDDGVRYGGKGLRAYPARRPAFWGRLEALVMDGDMRSLLYGCPERCLFFCAQSSPHVVRRVVLARQ
jgi:hypothetical protein